MIKISLLIATLELLASVNANYSCIDYYAISTSTTASGCVCQQGTYGTPQDATPAGSGCTLCPTGTNTTGQAPNQNAIVISACSTCYDKNAKNNGSTTSPACTCNTGYVGTPATSSGGTECMQTFACTDSNTVSTTATANGCVCKKGFYGTPKDATPAGSGCNSCPPGTTTIDQATNQNAVPISACSFCFDSNASSNGSPTAPACTCNSGYYGTPATTMGVTGCNSASKVILPFIALLFSFLFLI